MNWVRTMRASPSFDKPLSLGSSHAHIPDEDNEASDSLIRNGTDQTFASSEQAEEISVHVRNNIAIPSCWKENILGISALVWIVMGLVVFTFGFSDAKHRNFVSALYLVVQIITTVGYGDIVDRGASMRLFMSFYIFIGNILTSLVITERLQAIVRSSHDVLKMQAISTMVTPNADGRRPMPTSEEYSKHKRVVVALGIYLLFILAGTVYFGQVHKCSCPMGSAHHCSSGADISECIDSGGHERTLLDGFYMSVVTLTSVGFGDEVPQSVEGRLLASVWMLLGVASMANFIGEMARAIMIHNMNKLADRGISQELFNIIDADGSGLLSKFEFTTYMLVKYGLVSEEDLQTLCAEFEKFDKDGSGTLSYAEVERHHHHTHKVHHEDKEAKKSHSSGPHEQPKHPEKECSREPGPGLELHRGRYAH